EALDVARLKADPRLSEVVQRAVELSVKPAPEELVLYADGVFVSVKERDVRCGARDRRRARGRPGSVPHGAAPPLLRALRRAARAARAAELRRPRARAEAQRIPDEIPRPRPPDPARREARRASADVAGFRAGGGGRHPRARRAEAAPARPPRADVRSAVERPRPATARRRADADRGA